MKHSCLIHMKNCTNRIMIHMLIKQPCYYIVNLVSSIWGGCFRNGLDCRRVAQKIVQHPCSVSLMYKLMINTNNVIWLRWVLYGFRDLNRWTNEVLYQQMVLMAKSVEKKGSIAFSIRIETISNCMWKIDKDWEMHYRITHLKE